MRRAALFLRISNCFLQAKFPTHEIINVELLLVEPSTIFSGNDIEFNGWKINSLEEGLTQFEAGKLLFTLTSPNMAESYRTSQVRVVVSDSFGFWSSVNNITNTDLRSFSNKISEKIP